MVALGREGFLTGEDLLAVLHRLADAEATVVLGGTRHGAIALEDGVGAVIVRLDGKPAIRLCPATLRGGWCSAPNEMTDRWLVDIDLHGDGCEMLIDQLRFFRWTQLGVPA